MKNCKARKTYKKLKVLGIIPARGGSKGMPKKNIRHLLNKPLIVWTIEQALKSKYIDRVIVSTDDPAIAKISRKHGADVPFMRPAELATDKAKSIGAVFHALLSLPEKYDYVVLLQPTSPLRTADDIDACVKLCMSKGGNSCVSVTESEKNPHWMYSLNKNGRMHKLIQTEKTIDRRQDLPKVYALNGAIYVAQVDWLLNNKAFVTDETYAYIMPKERSVDIDNDLDFRFAEFLLLRQ
ncbi:MAG: acylneuraminate cytidylyltransferase family protein [Thermodesulfovibrionales bacterium]